MTEVFLYFDGDKENGRQLQAYFKSDGRLEKINAKMSIKFIDTKYTANKALAKKNGIERTPTLNRGPGNKPLVGNNDILKFFDFVIGKVMSETKVSHDEPEQEPEEELSLEVEDDVMEGKFDPRQEMADFSKRRAQYFDKYKGNVIAPPPPPKKNAKRPAPEIFDDDQAFLSKSGRDNDEDNISMMADENETMLEDYYNKEADACGRKLNKTISKRR